MLRIVAAFLALVTLTSTAYAEGPAGPAAALFTQGHSENRLLMSLAPGSAPHSSTTPLACCKVCSVGKACGNSCISREKTCHVGQGCACDG
jgi:hypothetical protein